MKLTVNGVAHEVESPPLTTLLAVLREELGITSPKAGCEQGGCGACTVLVGGEARRACLLPLAALDGADAGEDLAAAHRFDHLRERGRGAADRRLDGAVPAIAHPARQPARLRLPARPLPIADTLHSPGDPQAPRDWRIGH